LGGELPPRAARPCDCSQRAAPEAASFRVRLLSSRRPHAPWAGQGNARVQNSLRNLGSRAFPWSTGWIAPPLWSGGLARRPFHPSLIYVCALSMCEPQGSAWLGSGHVRAIQRSSWSNAGSKFSLGARKDQCHSRRITFRRATGDDLASFLWWRCSLQREFHLSRFRRQHLVLQARSRPFEVDWPRKRGLSTRIVPKLGFSPWSGKSDWKTILLLAVQNATGCGVARARFIR